MPSRNPQLFEGCKDTGSCAGQGCAGRRKGLNTRRLETWPLPPTIWVPQARERLTDSGVSASLLLNHVDVSAPERPACGQWTASRLLCTNRPRTWRDFGRGDLTPVCSVTVRGWVTRAALRTRVPRCPLALVVCTRCRDWPPVPRGLVTWVPSAVKCRDTRGGPGHSSGAASQRAAE